MGIFGVAGEDMTMEAQCVGEQAGLGFEEDLTIERGASFKLDQYQTWTGESGWQTIEQARNRLAVCVSGLERLPPGVKALYQSSLGKWEAEIAEEAEKGGSPGEEVYWVWGDVQVVDAHEVARVVESAPDWQRDMPGALTRTRKRFGGVEVVFFAPGVGSIRMHTRDGVGYRDFTPGLNPLALPSVRDGMESFEVIEDQWRPIMCGGAISEATDGIPSIQAVSVGSRLVAVSGASYLAEESIGHGFELVQRSLWLGPVMTYKRILKAWDDGELERGDKRGLEVSLKGARYVFGRPVSLVDRRSREDRTAFLRCGLEQAADDAEVADACDSAVCDVDGDDEEAQEAIQGHSATGSVGKQGQRSMTTKEDEQFALF